MELPPGTLIVRDPRQAAFLVDATRQHLLAPRGRLPGRLHQGGDKPAPVTPPAWGIDIQMQPFTPAGRLVSPALERELSRHLR